MTSIEDSHKMMVSINFGTAAGGGGMSRPQDTKTKKILICEIAALIVTIGLVWMLLLLPIIFYHLPDKVYTGKVSTNLHMQPTSV